MNQDTTGNFVRRKQTLNWGLIALLAAPAAIALWFVSQKLHYIIDFSESSYSPYFWPRGAGLWIHASTGLVALSVGLVQIWLGLTQQTGQLHRILGRIYVAAITISSVAGLYMASTIPEVSAYQVGLFALNLVWIACTAMAVFAIRLRNIRQHKEWMLRSYTVTFAFIFFRLFVDLLEARSVMDVGTINTIMAWASWAVPLVILEVAIQYRTLTRSKARA